MRLVPRVLFFDVNETLLDLNHVKHAVADTLAGKEEKVDLWFSTLLHHSLVEMTTGQFHDFTDIGVAALQMVAHSMDISLSEEQARQTIATPMTQLPAHPDVPDALTRLKAAGYTLVAFSNSSEKGLRAQLAYAGIRDHFDGVLSVQQVKTYKPLKTAYEWACAQTDVQAAESLMIAAHGWDLCGAANAGMQTAFIARPGKMPYPLGPMPDIKENNLTALADRLSRDN
ncbi:haloacid dehalogenase type II [Alteromonas halophila]|uniref:(S)-2-haloacid dehalogenase n=1 Tax=Alteromonas halophila TaxID=516698 RepID=A0A918JJ85_9ALTE|nr:haloacid dehalogenase type II [Alteromonas halophila]GGW83867.1 haloacid dehalogenase [Alteromonas halophila]